jgi:hypothetical protein
MRCRRAEIAWGENYDDHRFRVHIWLLEAPDRPWMPGRTAHLPEPLTYQKFSAMMDEAGVSHAILVPPSWEGESIDYSLEAAQKFPAIRHLQAASIADGRFFPPDLVTIAAAVLVCRAVTPRNGGSNEIFGHSRRAAGRPWSPRVCRNGRIHGPGQRQMHDR